MDREPFKLPGHGLVCKSCGTSLPEVNRTTTSDGFVMRERRCPKCGQVNVTDERVLTARAVRSRKVTIRREDYL